MPPYKKLAIIVLAASSVSPALSVPTRECQKQSRGEVEERMNMVLLERLGTDFTLREVSTFPERSFGSSSKRATETPESRAFTGKDRLLLGVAGAGALAASGILIAGAVKQHEKDKDQRDISSAPMIAALNVLDNRADVPQEDSDTFLRLLSLEPHPRRARLSASS